MRVKFQQYVLGAGLVILSLFDVSAILALLNAAKIPRFQKIQYSLMQFNLCISEKNLSYLCLIYQKTPTKRLKALIQRFLPTLPKKLLQWPISKICLLILKK
jgi:hypothetical protein